MFKIASAVIIAGIFGYHVPTLFPDMSSILQLLVAFLGGVFIWFLVDSIIPDGD